jgi:hypothetical protein
VIETAMHDEGDYTFGSVSGDLRMLVPAGQALTVQSRLVSGKLSCALPHETEKEGWGRQVVRVNGGGVLVRARSTSGAIVIAQSKAGPSGEPFAAQQATAAESGVPKQTAPQNPEREPFALDDVPLEDEGPGSAEEDQRMAVLRAIEDGEIGVSEGLERLRSLE